MAYSRIKEGSCPDLSVDHNWKIDRQEVVDQVIEEFIEIDGSDRCLSSLVSFLGQQGRGKPS